jgi:hypothetical protein
VAGHFGDGGVGGRWRRASGARRLRPGPRGGRPPAAGRFMQMIQLCAPSRALDLPSQRNQIGGYARDHRSWLATLCEHQGGVPFAWLVSLRRGRNWSPRTGRLLCALLTRTRLARAGVLELPLRGMSGCVLDPAVAAHRAPTVWGPRPSAERWNGSATRSLHDLRSGSFSLP